MTFLHIAVLKGDFYKCVLEQTNIDILSDIALTFDSPL